MVTPPANSADRTRHALSAVLADPARAIFVLVLSLVLSLAIVGLPLALLGIFYPLPVAILTTLVWLPLTWAAWRLTDSGDTSTVASWLVVGGAIAFAIFTTTNSGEHVLTDRDPGVYVITGKWLANNGNLLYNTGLPTEIAESLAHPNSWSAQGIYAGKPGTGYFQFQHLTGVVLAASSWVGGDWLLFRIFGIIASVSLLGLFLLSRRVAGPVFGALPVVVAALHPAFIHFAKDVYSEWLAMSFALAAYVIWLNRGTVQAAWRYLGVGVLLAAGTLARIDAWLTAAAFFAGVGYLVLTGGETRPNRKHLLLMVGGFVPLAALSTIDLVTRSPFYLSDLTEEAVPMFLMVVVATAVAIVLSFVPPIRLESVSRLLRTVVPLLALVILAAGVFGLFIRPHVSEPTQASWNGRIAEIQMREGVEVDGSRTYAESTFKWMARYQGYLPVTFGIAAVALAWFVIFKKRGDYRVPLILTLVGVGAVYFYRPSITPDHLWALRRFLPIVLPLAFVFTAWAARFVLRWLGSVTFASLVVMGVLALALAQSLVVGWPVAAVRTQVGVLGAITKVCASLPPDSVILVDFPAWQMLPGVIRTECDLPVASLRDPGIADKLRQAGLVPVAIHSSGCGGDLDSLDVEFEFPEETVSIAPRGPETGRLLGSFSVADGMGLATPSILPASADASFEVLVQTEWVPVDGSSVIVSLDEYQEGMWLEYQPTGAVELWVTTTAGSTGVLATTNIADDVERSIGGYIQDGVLVATCGGQISGSEVVPGTITFDTANLEINPVQGGNSGNLEFEGTIEVLSD